MGKYVPKQIINLQNNGDLINFSKLCELNNFLLTKSGAQPVVIINASEIGILVRIKVTCYLVLGVYTPLP